MFSRDKDEHHRTDQASMPLVRGASLVDLDRAATYCPTLITDQIVPYSSPRIEQMQSVSPRGVQPDAAPAGLSLIAIANILIKTYGHR